MTLRSWVGGGVLAWGLLGLAAGGSAEGGEGEFDFAPLRARHDPSARYALPFPPDIPRLLSQGNGGENTDRDTHVGAQHYAFDFLVPQGGEIWAAREGVVARVDDGATLGSRDREARLPANFVFVLHDDGSFAQYGHLQAGIPVEVGQRVEVGQLIGYGGCTGFCDAPHLHFAVAVRQGRGFRTVPILFGEPGSPGAVPRSPLLYGAQRKATVKLEVDAGGRTVVGEEPIGLRHRGSIQLRVFLRQRNGARKEVTGHKGLRFASLTPWSLDVDDAGVVTARPLPGYEEFEALATGSEIIVVFGRLDGRLWAQRQIAFEIEGPGASAP